MSQSSADLLRFRCMHCGQLLGASRSKAGRWVNCPACETETLVPKRSEEPEPNDQSSLSPISAESSSNTTPPTTSSPSMPTVGEMSTVEINAIPATMNDVEAISQALIGNKAAPRRAVAAIGELPTELETREQLKYEATTSSTKAHNKNTMALATTLTRRRDVLMPRTAVIAWSLVALLAIGLAFLSGLLIGHYLWTTSR